MAESHSSEGRTPPPHAEPFRFEHTVEVSEATYIELYQMRPPSPLQRVLVVGLAAAGLTLLVGGWTRSLGGLMVLSAAIVWCLPRVARRGVRDAYARAPYLRGPATFGVSERSIWMRGGPLRAESDWTGLDYWDRRGDWIVLGASGMPPVMLPAGEMGRAGLLDRVLALARASASALAAERSEDDGRRG